MVQLQYGGNTPSDVVKGLFERFFSDGEIPIINIRSDTRIINVSDIISNNANGRLNIYESAIVSGFDNGGWKDVTSIMLSGNNIMKDGERNVISCTPVTENRKLANAGLEILTIYDDDDGYVLQKIGNSILLFCALDDLRPNSLKEILLGLGYHCMDDKEYFTSKMMDLILSVNKTTVASTKKRLAELEKMKQISYREFMSHLNESVELERQMVGMESFDGELSAKTMSKFERLLRSSSLESLEIYGDTIVITTKPLKLGIWDMGTFEITYNAQSSMPQVRRLGVPVLDSVKYVAYNGDTISYGDIDHPHVKHRNPCTGNAEGFIKDFWKKDMLLGFNHLMQYLRSYSKRRGPHLGLIKFLAMLGYQKDAKVLQDNNITIYLIDDGEMYKDTDAKKKITEAKLRKLGCTGVAYTDPDEIEEFLIRSIVGKERSLIGSIEYHPAESE